MRQLAVVGILLISHLAFGQNVGIGTTNPNSRAILDLNTNNKVLLLPRLSNTQMNAIVSPPYGGIIYNTDRHQYMGYVFSHNAKQPLGGIVPVNKWLPITTGPKMIAWGIVDSFANELNTSGNCSVIWSGYGNNTSPNVNSTNNWYELTLSAGKFYKDSMILLITAVGNGSWDQAISISELNEGTLQRATIKFTDISRVAAGWNVVDSRRRSNFHFVVYDLRNDPH
jgi:hypothetical protein